MVLSLIKGMDKNTFQNEVCVLSSKGCLGDEFEKEAKVYYLNYPKWKFKAIKTLFFLLKRNRYDIIHIYGLRANIIGRIVGRLAGCSRIVSGLRSKSLGEKTGKFRIAIEMALDKLTFWLIKFYISNTKAAVDFLVKNGYPRSKFRLVHNGIDIDAFNLTPDSSLKEVLEDKPVLIHIGNFRPLKGHKLLINALKIVKDDGFVFRLLLVGDGDLKDDIVNYSSSIGLIPDIIFLGKMDNVGPYLAISDIFVLPSIVEGMPVSIMEACLARLPIVSFDVGGVSEIVINNETGILVAQGDIKGLAKAIEELLMNKEKRKSMGEAGFNRIKQEFSLYKMINGVSCVYLELMKKQAKTCQ